MKMTLFSLGQWFLKGGLVLAVVILVIVPLIHWVLARFIKRHNIHRSSAVSEMQDQDGEGKDIWRGKQRSAREKLQRDHEVKAEGFVERVLKPQEEAKKEKKEKELYRFMGPAWKGKGNVLGEDKDLETHSDQEQEQSEVKGMGSSPGRQAAKRRRIQHPTPQPASQNPTRQKIIIKLPEEPEETSANTVLVILRSPIQTFYRRRFHMTDTVQMLLDFMTVSGFSKLHNTLCTSYPRQDIGVDKTITLQQLGFRSQVTLNIEEKETRHVEIYGY